MTLSGNLASMACALPYACAAQLAHPDRQVICFAGDGGFSMLMAEMATAVKYKLPIKCVIIKNDYYGMIKWEQMVFLGNPEFGVDLQPIDFVMAARAFGVEAFHLENPEQAGDVVERFLHSPGPAVLEAVVDPRTAPLPAKIRAKQAFHFVESLLRGQPEAKEIMRAAFKDKIRQVV
ncbi:MAG: thiamine pyrophosphate-dependent enzyme, partial [Candidatus Korobacteraceae bacterium]